MLSFGQARVVLQHKPSNVIAVDDNTQRQGVDFDTARYRVLTEDAVSLDYLVGVVELDDSYTFVQYIATNRHKASAGTRLRVVDRLNVFIDELRSQGVHIEVALCYVAASRKTTLWLQVSLSQLSELSLEPLWLISGRVRINTTTRFLLIHINDPDLEFHTLVNGRLEKKPQPVEDRVVDSVENNQQSVVIPTTEDNDEQQCDDDKCKNKEPKKYNLRQHYKRYKVRNKHKKQLYCSAQRFINNRHVKCDNENTTDSVSEQQTFESKHSYVTTPSSSSPVRDNNLAIEPSLSVTEQPSTDYRVESAETETDNSFVVGERLAKCLVM